ncbi:MAG: hypothetical protein AB8H03_19180 [Saprospiraceae bacterium]
MKKHIIKLSIVLFASSLFLQSCLHDVRPKMLKRNGITTENTLKGKQILDRVWKKQGGDKLEKHDVYSFQGFDTWKKNRFGKIGKLWPDFETTLEFKFQVDTLDGQLIFLDGERKGTIAGIYNSNYYEIKNGKTEFQDRTAKSNRRAVFGLSHIQYFFELLGRLRQAPIISYAGQKEFNGNQYDLVFCTWGKPKPHLAHDQYLLWINKKTGLLDYSEYSVREPHVKPPGYKMIGGNIEYTDYREIDGVWIPHDQIVYPIKKKTNQDKFVHRLKISDFQFDSFNVNELKPTEKGK